MKRRRKVVISVLAIIGLTGAFFGLGETYTGGCSGCKQTTAPELDGGGDHYFSNQSEDINKN